MVARHAPHRHNLCDLCGEVIWRQGEAVSPGKYPFTLPGYRDGDGKVAHRKCANRVVYEQADYAAGHPLDGEPTEGI